MIIKISGRRQKRLYYYFWTDFAYYSGVGITCWFWTGKTVLESVANQWTTTK